MIEKGIRHVKQPYGSEPGFQTMIMDLALKSFCIKLSSQRPETFRNKKGCLTKSKIWLYNNTAFRALNGFTQKTAYSKNANQLYSERQKEVFTLPDDFSTPARANPPSPPFTKGGLGGF